MLRPLPNAPVGGRRADHSDNKATELRVRCELDVNTYAKGVKVHNA
jgi:hypothetical protein